MSHAIIDARGWQSEFDLRTGRKSSKNSAKIRLVKNVLNDHPYPGDLDAGSNKWVTDTALDLINRYSTDFAFLIYAAQMYTLRFNRPEETFIQKEIDAAFSEAVRFIKESGFSAIVVGTGDMVPVKGYIDLTCLHGLAVTSNWSARYSALYGPDKEDFRYLKNTEGIERIAAREEFLSLFPDAPSENCSLSHYIAVAEKGYCFRSSMLRTSFMVPAVNEFIPVHGISPGKRYLTEVGLEVLGSLQYKKTAIILIEGAGVDSFRLPFSRCKNGKEWFNYEPGGAQYLTLSTGRDHVFVYPPGSLDYVDNDDKKEYPFSGYFTSIPDGTLGQRFDGKSIAVGNRSMFMHTVTGADISIECFARNLYNQGCMGVVHR